MIKILKSNLRGEKDSASKAYRPIDYYFKLVSLKTNCLSLVNMVNDDPGHGKLTLLVGL